MEHGVRKSTCSCAVPDRAARQPSALSAVGIEVAGIKDVTPSLTTAAAQEAAPGLRAGPKGVRAIMALYRARLPSVRRERTKCS